MDKREARQKHNKSSKYKQRAKQNNIKESENTKDEKQLNEQTLPNNWSKYKISEESEEEQSIGANFDILSQEPISQDSFFKFKSEQNWDNDIGQMQLSKYFTLDLKLLSEGVMCVPFTKRQDLDRSLFTVAELENIDNTADTYRKKYEKYLKQRFPAKSSTKCVTNEAISPQSNEKDINKNKKNNENIVKENVELSVEKNNTELVSENTQAEINDLNKIAPKKPREKHVAAIAPETTVERKKEAVAVKTLNENKKIVEDDVDDLLNLEFNETTISAVEIVPIAEDPLLMSNVTVKNVTPQTAVDLEQWLDDILDD